jgi:hypothetical protein
MQLYRWDVEEEVRKKFTFDALQFVKVPELGYVSHYEGVRRNRVMALYIPNTFIGCTIMDRRTLRSLFHWKTAQIFGRQEAGWSTGQT